MTHEIFVLLRAALKAKGMPFEIVYGPSQVPDKVGGTRIEMSRDYESGDRVLPGKADTRNPPMVAVRAMSSRIRIFARDTIEGAQRHNHERLAERIADMIHASLIPICRESKTQWRVIRAGFVSDATSDGWAGVVFDLRIEIDRGVYAFPNWTQAELDEVDAQGIGATTLTTSGNGSTDLPSATTRVS